LAIRNKGRGRGQRIKGHGCVAGDGRRHGRRPTVDGTCTRSSP
jgi:hypothetical protein